MSARKLSTQLRELGACDEAVEWAKPYDALQEAWDVCQRGDWMLWLCERVDLEGDALPNIAFACAEMALKDASAALRSAADASPDKDHAETLRHHAGLLEVCVVDSRAAAMAASDAAGAASTATRAASTATRAARNAAIADLVRKHIPNVIAILEKMEVPK